MCLHESVSACVCSWTLSIQAGLASTGDCQQCSPMEPTLLPAMTLGSSPCSLSAFTTPCKEHCAVRCVEEQPSR